MDKHTDMIVILDFGSQYTHIIARRIRELSVYCELHPCTISAEEIKALNPKGIVLSGGPSSVYEEGAPHLDKEIWNMDVPMLGICYGLQEMTTHYGGQVEPSDHAEYGHAELKVTDEGVSSHLFEGMETDTHNVVWMSHGDKVTKMPEGFVNIGVTGNSPHAAISNPAKKLFAVQFHLEVSHTPRGKEMLSNFVLKICSCNPSWSMGNYVDIAIERIKEQVGDAQCVGLISGGVDSTVAAVLVHRAIGSRFKGYFIDNGLLRLNEGDQVMTSLGSLGINIERVNAQKRFLDRLAGKDDPEDKRKTIGNVFIEVIEEKSKEFSDAEFLLQGTLYPDVIESISYKGPSATIKSHHNVGGLLANMKLKLVEPLRELFKDEVRALGLLLGISENMIYRMPFPGPGLAIRTLTSVAEPDLEILRYADHIYIDEIKKAGLYKDIGQAFCVLLPCRSVGVMGDSRTYEKVIALRAVATTDFMTAKWFHMPYEVLEKASSRIINEVKGVNRVVFDVSSKPPSTIEWE